MSFKRLIRETGYISAISILLLRENKKNKQIKKYYNLSDKYQADTLMLNQWLKKQMEGRELAAYLKSIGVTELAIYGLGDIGLRVVQALEKTDICIKYVIDKEAYGLVATEIEKYTVEEELPEVELIIVTPIQSFNEIESNLKKKGNYKIMSLEDIIYEM